VIRCYHSGYPDYPHTYVPHFLYKNTTFCKNTGLIFNYASKRNLKLVLSFIEFLNLIIRIFEPNESNNITNLLICQNQFQKSQFPFRIGHSHLLNIIIERGEIFFGVKMLINV